MDKKGKMVATICHGGSVFISAGIVKGRHMTCMPNIIPELTGAGAIFEDEAVVIDGNMVTSRMPPDLHNWGEGIIEVLKRQK